jgi:hypothetical protein
MGPHPQCYECDWYSSPPSPPFRLLIAKNRYHTQRTAKHLPRPLSCSLDWKHRLHRRRRKVNGFRSRDTRFRVESPRSPITPPQERAGSSCYGDQARRSARYTLQRAVEQDTSSCRT